MLNLMLEYKNVQAQSETAAVASYTILTKWLNFSKYSHIAKA